MKPLNPFFYVVRNPKKILPVFFSVSMGVLLIYIFSLFTATTNKMISAASFDVTEKFNIVYTKDNTTLPQPFLEETGLRHNMIPVQMNISGLPYYRGGMGGTTILTFNIFEDDVITLLDDYHIELTEGGLPRNNQGEILVPEEIALQNELGVGDYMGSDVSEKYSLQGKYRICGITKGNPLFSVTCQPGEETKEQVMEKGVMYPIDILGEGKQKHLLSLLTDNVVVINRDYYEQAYSVTQDSMDTLMYILTAVMVIVLCIALGSLYSVLLAGRRNELNILHSMGYTKGMVKRKLWMENLMVCGGGYFGGIIVTTFFVWLVNMTLLMPRGKMLESVNFQGMFLASALPVFVSVYTVLLRRIDS